MILLDSDVMIDLLRLYESYEKLCRSNNNYRISHMSVYLFCLLYY